MSSSSSRERAGWRRKRERFRQAGLARGSQYDGGRAPRAPEVQHATHGRAARRHARAAPSCPRCTSSSSRRAGLRSGFQAVSWRSIAQLEYLSQPRAPRGRGSARRPSWHSKPLQAAKLALLQLARVLSCCPSSRQRASDSAKSALTVQPQTVLARQLPRSGVPRAAHCTAAARPVRGLRCTRCAQRSAVVRRRGARRASGLMQLCPRCFRDLRAGETACGRGWRARRARATHSRLDGSKRSVFRGPLKSPALLALLAAKMMPLILGHLLCIDQ